MMRTYSPKMMCVGPRTSGRGGIPFRVHAVDDDTGRALCSTSSFRGWNDVPGMAITCVECMRRAVRKRREFQPRPVEAQRPAFPEYKGA